MRVQAYSPLLVLFLAVLPGCRRSSEEQPVVLPAQGIHLAPLTENRVKVLVFVRIDCPISNRYAPEICRLHDRYAENVSWWLVYPNPTLTVSQINDHVREFGYPCRTFHDEFHQLVREAGATITPEAAVYTAQNRLVYCGRIDDRYTEFGKSRPVPTQHNLREAIEAALAGESVSPQRRKAIGCYIKDFRVLAEDLPTK